MSRSETKKNRLLSRLPVPEPGLFRGRRSNSVDHHMKQTMLSYRTSRASSEERKSGSSVGTRFSGARKSSVSQSETKPSIKDPRPLNNKQYQRKKITELIELCQSEGSHFSSTLTASKLMQISKKDFEVIFQFLVNFFEPSYQVQKLEDEAPKMLRNIAYPYVPKKSDFLYAAPSSVPVLLGVLFFLMDIIKYILQVDPNMFFQCCDSERPEEYAILLEYICKCYACETDSDEEQAIFTKIISSRMVDVESLQEDNHKKKEELAKLEKHYDLLQSLQKQSEERSYEIERYEEYFGKMDERMAKKEKECGRLQQELAQRKEDLSKVQSVLRERQAAYDLQGFDGKKQVVFYEEQRKELGEVLHQKKESLKEKQNACWELEMQLSQALDKGTSKCSEFAKRYGECVDATSALIRALQQLKSSAAQSLLSSHQMEPLPPLHMDQKNPQSSANLKVSLEEILSRFNTASLFFKGLVSALGQKLQEILLKKSEMSMGLKVASVQESQHDRERISKHEQFVDEIKTYEAKFDSRMQQLKQLQLERGQIEGEIQLLKKELKKSSDGKFALQKKLDVYMKRSEAYLKEQAEYVDSLTEYTKENCNKVMTSTNEALTFISENEL